MTDWPRSKKAKFHAAHREVMVYLDAEDQIILAPMHRVSAVASQGDGHVVVKLPVEQGQFHAQLLVAFSKC
jgi:hypothetical protein